MQTTVAVLFLLAYLGIALGRVPGLALDRTGIALLGAIAMIGVGAITTSEALQAIDVSTILLLYALMVVSAQFRLGGFYTWAALRITRYMDQPKWFLLLLMAVSALFSSVLANDIVCLAFTPVVTVALLGRGFDPVPYLIGLAVSSNIGSAATIIGNPQNMLIGQLAHLNFGGFPSWCLPPSLAALAAAYLILIGCCRTGLAVRNPPRNVAADGWPQLNRHQSGKGLIAASILLLLFFTPVPREMSAIAVAGCLLCSRKMKTRAILGLVDWHLITLFCSLFIIIGALQTTGIPARLMTRLTVLAIDPADPYILTLISTLLSNFTSNVPAVMLLTKFLDPANTQAWYLLALSSTFAGNLVVIGSIANLIVIEEARHYGVNISFGSHARVGVPVTVATLVIVFLWIYLARL